MKQKSDSCGSDKSFSLVIFKLLIVIIVFINTLSFAQPVSSGSFVGTGLAMTSLSNFPIGQNYDRKISIRFKADYSGTLALFRVFWIYKNSSGYHGGDGGDIRITLRDDDGTDAHLPSTRSLATTVFSPRLPLSYPTRVDVRFKDLTFSSKPRLAKNRIYHLVFENIDSNKTRNWISINSVYNHSRDVSRYQPAEHINEWGLLNRSGNGKWSYTNGYCPTLSLGISTSYGSTPDVYQGNGYMEFWGAASNRTRVGGNLLLRQVFKANNSIRVGGVSVNAGRYAGNGSLKVELLSASGEILDSSNISSGNFPTASSRTYCPKGLTGEKCHVWGYARFGRQPTVTAGQTYFLRLSAASGSDYRFNFPRDGSVMYKWPLQTVINGRVEKSSNGGSSWSGITYWGVSNRSDADLEFFLEAA